MGQALETGARVCGRYELVAPTRYGEFGSFWRARDVLAENGTPVLVEIVEARTVSETLDGAVQRHVRRLRAVDHSSVLPLLDGSVIDARIVLVHTAVDGTSLAESIAECAKTEQVIDWGVALRRFHLVASAVEAAHEIEGGPLLHEGLTAESVIVGEGRVHVIDFGVSALAGRGPSVGDRAGAWRAHQAPEQTRSPGRAIVETDVFALGVLLLEMLLARRSPPDSEATWAEWVRARDEAPLALTRWRPDVPEALGPVLARALNWRPNRRWGSVRELLAGLREAVPSSRWSPLRAETAIAPLAAPLGASTETWTTAEVRPARVNVASVVALSEQDLEEISDVVPSPRPAVDEARYKVQHVIVSTERSELRLAEDLRSGRDVVLKSLRPQLRRAADLHERLDRDRRVTARFRRRAHNVVRVLDCFEGSPEGAPVLVLEPLRGATLAAEIMNLGPMALDAAMPIVEQLSELLHEAHELDILHGHLRPDRVFLHQEEPFRVVKVLGWGDAIEGVRQGRKTSRGGARRLVDPREDILSQDVRALARMTFWMLTGRDYHTGQHVYSPLQRTGLDQGGGGTPQERAATFGVTLPQGFDAWFERCVAPRAGAMFAHAGEAWLLFRCLRADPELAVPALDGAATGEWSMPPEVAPADDSLSDAPTPDPDAFFIQSMSGAPTVGDVRVQTLVDVTTHDVWVAERERGPELAPPREPEPERPWTPEPEPLPPRVSLAPSPRVGPEFTVVAHPRTVRGVAVTADGSLAVTASADRTLRVWDLERREPLHTLRGHLNPVTAVALNRDGTRIASASSDQTLTVWNLVGQEVEPSSLSLHRSGVNGVSMSPDGRFGLSCGDDGSVRLWDLDTLRQIWCGEGHSGPVYGVALRDDARVAASCGADGLLIVWDLVHGDQLGAVRAHEGEARAVAWSHRGEVLATGGADGCVRVWRHADLRNVHTLHEHRETVSAVTFSPDDRTLVSASWDLSLRAWDLDTGACRAVLVGHTYAVQCAAWWGSAADILSGGSDGTLCGWKLP